MNMDMGELVLAGMLGLRIGLDLHEPKRPETTSLLMKDLETRGPGEGKLHSEIDGRRSSEDLHSGLGQQRSRGTPRSLLSSVRSKTRRAPPPISTICSSDGHSTVLVNGHTDPGPSISSAPSPLSKHKSLSNYSPRAFLQRRKHKLELSFGRHKSPGFVKADSAPTPPRHAELHLSSLKHLGGGPPLALQKAPVVRNKSSQSLSSKPSFKTVAQHPDQEPSTSNAPQSPTRAAQSDDEHELIAFCSALLHVSPMTTAASSSLVPANYPTSFNNLTLAQPTPKPFPPPPPRVLAEPSQSFNFDTDDFPPPSPPPIPANNKPQLSPIMGSPYQASEDSPPASKDGDAFDEPSTSEACDERSLAKSTDRSDKNRICTSFRIYISSLKNPVDACLLPNEHFAIADYDNGFVILKPSGEVLHHRNSQDDKNACGIACAPEMPIRLYVLVFKDGTWSINVYEDYRRIDCVQCPTDNQIENWALRKIGVGSSKSLHLMASGETKVTIWLYDLAAKSWSILATENSRRGGYNDISLRIAPGPPEELNVLLCDWRKSQLCTVVFSNDRHELLEQRSIKVRRVKGQEWIVQGPTLAVLDEQSDIVVYDGSGKLFFFDGDTNKCKKIVADIGRGEVSAIFVKHGWVYVLCRYRLCLEIYLYKEFTETVL